MYLVEIKSKCAPATEQHARAIATEYGQEVVCVAGDEVFQRALLSTDYKRQVMHQMMVVPAAQGVIFAVGTPSRLLYTVVVLRSPAVQDYKHQLDALVARYQLHAFHDRQLPQRFPQELIGIFHSHLHFAWLLSRDIRTYGPLMSVASIRHAIQSAYAHGKVRSDEPPASLQGCLSAPVSHGTTWMHCQVGIDLLSHLIHSIRPADSRLQMEPMIVTRGLSALACNAWTVWRLLCVGKRNIENADGAAGLRALLNAQRKQLLFVNDLGWDLLEHAARQRVVAEHARMCERGDANRAPGVPTYTVVKAAVTKLKTKKRVKRSWFNTREGRVVRGTRLDAFKHVPMRVTRERGTRTGGDTAQGWCKFCTRREESKVVEGRKVTTQCTTCGVFLCTTRVDGDDGDDSVTCWDAFHDHEAGLGLVMEEQAASPPAARELVSPRTQYRGWVLRRNTSHGRSRRNVARRLVVPARDDASDGEGTPADGDRHRYERQQHRARQRREEDDGRHERRRRLPAGFRANLDATPPSSGSSASSSLSRQSDSSGAPTPVQRRAVPRFAGRASARGTVSTVTQLRAASARATPRALSASAARGAVRHSAQRRSAAARAQSAAAARGTARHSTGTVSATAAAAERGTVSAVTQPRAASALSASAARGPVRHSAQRRPASAHGTARQSTGTAFATAASSAARGTVSTVTQLRAASARATPRALSASAARGAVRHSAQRRSAAARAQSAAAARGTARHSTATATSMAASSAARGTVSAVTQLRAASARAARPAPRALSASAASGPVRHSAQRRSASARGTTRQSTGTALATAASSAARGTASAVTQRAASAASTAARGTVTSATRRGPVAGMHALGLSPAASAAAQVSHDVAAQQVPRGVHRPPSPPSGLLNTLRSWTGFVYPSDDS